MITYYIAILRQLETLFIGITLLAVRSLITKERLQDAYPDSLKHWGWYYYFFMLWFVILPCFMMRNNWPHYGIWSMLYAFNPYLCWISLAMTLGLSSYAISKR